MIRFNKLVAQAEFLSPLKSFQPDSQPIEYREDPLLGLTSVVRTGRQFWGSLYKTDEALLKQMVEGSRGRCFFCPAKAATATPRFLPDFIPEGRLTRGEAILFPNLFAQKEHSAICVMTGQHYLPLNGFTPALLSGALKLSADYIGRVHRAKAIKYAEIGWNYLFPGGASIVHPHLQVLCSDMAYYLLREMVARGQRHQDQYGRNFWEELVDTEQKKGERYLGRIGDTEWLLPFAPTREDEVNAVVQGKSHFLELGEADWEALAEGLCRVLRYYGAKGLSSFNLALYSGPLAASLPYFWMGLKIVSRTSVQPMPVNDVWYSNNILIDGFVTEPPEDLARGLRPYFS
ncbi:MAG: hypothetical protein AAB270_03945 [Chloroflexota bacterium]